MPFHCEPTRVGRHAGAREVKEATRYSALGTVEGHGHAWQPAPRHAMFRPKAPSGREIFVGVKP